MNWEVKRLQLEITKWTIVENLNGTYIIIIIDSDKHT